MDVLAEKTPVDDIRDPIARDALRKARAERVLETIRAEIDKAKREHVPFDPTR